MIGLGLVRIDDLEECERVVIDAINLGYRLIDTAAIYGNEEAVGNAIRKCGIDRKELFITSKLWITENSYKKAKAAFYTSLDKLQTDYIDLYMIHRPFGDYYGAYRALQELYKEGKIKALGVSNFYMDRLLDLTMHFEIKPVINQIQCHPFMQRKFEKDFMKTLDIALESYSPFAVGLNNIFKHEKILPIAQKYNKTTAQVILRWHIQNGYIAIPKSVHIERLRENINIFDFDLNQDEMNLISTLDLSIENGEDQKRIDSIERAFKK